MTGNDFGNWKPATKSGVKFEDLDADGQPQEAGEPGLSGWTIYVDYDNDGQLDGNEPSDVTDANGAYTITGITPGTYKVREVLQNGWTQLLSGSRLLQRDLREPRREDRQRLRQLGQRHQVGLQVARP